MKWFDNLHPILQITLVVLGVTIILNVAAPYIAKIPVVGKYLA